ncbi:MAG: recombinase family protein [Chloroflexi bacterium]|nr:recombinase family protein [Chloroflexota bacterium]
MITYPEKNPPQRKRAAAYLRVSTEEQVRSGYSLTEQRQSIESWCQDNDYELTFFEDPGISGRKVNRPAFNAMLQAVTENQFDIVVVWKLDRLSRRPYIGYRLREAMDMTRTEFYSIVEGNTVNNRLAFGMWLLVAEAESETKSVRSRMGAEGRAHRQQLNSDKVTYGYVKGKDGKPEIYEPEASVVRRVFQEYVGCTPVPRVIEGLHRDGIYTRSGGVWVRASLMQMLDKETYIGKGFYNKTSSREGPGDSKIREKTERSDWILIPHPPIVDETVWEAAQDRKARFKGTKSDAKHRDNFPLAGLTFCASCGQRFVHNLSRYRYQKRADGTKFKVPRVTPDRWYTCIEGRTGRRGIEGFQCERRSIGAGKLERAVWDKVASVLRNPQLVLELLEERRREFKETGTSKDLEVKRAELSSLDAERERILDSHQRGYMTDAERDKRMKSITERREFHSRDLDRMDAELRNLEHKAMMVESFTANARTIASRLDELTEAERGDVMRSMVSRVVIGETIEVTMLVEPGDTMESGLNKLPINGADMPWRR